MSIFLRASYGRNGLTAKAILTDPVLFLAFGFGSGLSRYMPGTLGTLAALPVYYGLQAQGQIVYAIATVLSCVIGVWLCDQAARKLGEHDFGGIVWDEVAGLLVTLIGVPFSGQNMILGFVLFRIFDIFKPWPIRWLDRHIHGGLGIMLDDLLAGFFAMGVLRLLLLWV